MNSGRPLLRPFQLEMARLFFSLPESHGYVVAGGAALLASDLIARPTQDLDLFASAPITTVTEAREAFIAAARAAGHVVTVIHDSPTFARLVVAEADQSGGDAVLLDLALDSPPVGEPRMTVAGPTLSPMELAGRKLLALFGRAEARDFADVYALVQRFGAAAILEQAAMLDPGFDEPTLAQMMRTIVRFEDDEIPLSAPDVQAARQFFDRWSQELDRRQA